MRKWTIILLMAVYTFGTTDAYQLLKFPIMLQHFVEHRREDPKMSFIAFLRMHYADKIVVDEDFSRDMQLPFKTAEACCIAATVSMPAQWVSIDVPHPVVLQQAFFLFDEPVDYSLVHGDIFQPPRC